MYYLAQQSLFNDQILSYKLIDTYLITQVLFLDHPKRMIRDTSTYKPFKAAFGGRTPSLKNLSSRMIGVAVQQGEHSSVQDAQAAMRLYTMFKKDWEKDSKSEGGEYFQKGPERVQSKSPVGDESNIG